MSASLRKRIATLRARHTPGVLLAVPTGDFFEFYNDDAVVVSSAMGITLTARGRGADRVPMCGVPILNSWTERLAARWPDMEIAAVGAPVSRRSANGDAPCAALVGDSVLVDPETLQFGDGDFFQLARPHRSIVDDIMGPLGRLSSVALEVLPLAERRQLAEALRQKLFLIDDIDEDSEPTATGTRRRPVATDQAERHG